MRFFHSNPSNATTTGRFQKLKEVLNLLIFNILIGQVNADPTLHSVTLQWDGVPETNIQGYRVHVGTVSKQYAQSYDSGAEVSYAVNDLEFGKTYYFAVGTIDSTGIEGMLSDELVVTIAPPPLPGGTSISMDASGQPALQWTFPAADAGSAPDFIVYSSDDLVRWTVAGTIPVSGSTGGDGQSLHFSWPIQVTERRMFFRLTARNWMGDSTGP